MIRVRLPLPICRRVDSEVSFGVWTCLDRVLNLSGDPLWSSLRVEGRLYFAMVFRVLRVEHLARLPPEGYLSPS